MCIYCDQSLSDDQLYNHLLDFVLESFEIYNSVTIHHLIITSSGHKGPQNREISLQILENYNTWLTDNPYSFVDDIFTNEKIDSIIEFMNNNELINDDNNNLSDYLDRLYLSIE